MQYNFTKVGVAAYWVKWMDIACYVQRLINNYGDIQRIDPTTLPDFDLFTYSFLCQDISVAGYQCGLNEDSVLDLHYCGSVVRLLKLKDPNI